MLLMPRFVLRRLAEMDTPEERLVYQRVEEAGNKGIWSQPLRKATGLENTSFLKVIKKLEGKKLIKAVRSVTVFAALPFFSFIFLSFSQCGTYLTLAATENKVEVLHAV